MKKLFTLFACASLAFTLSAQSEQAAGSYYLGTGDALGLVDIFVGGVDLTATIGYAVIDDLVVTGSINSADNTEDGEDNSDITLDLGVRYFWNGVFFQAGATNLLSATDEDGAESDMSISLGVGKYFSLGSVDDRFYVDPQINYNLDTGFNTSIGLGVRF